MALWRKLSEFGSHHYTDLADKKLNIIANQLLLFFGIIVIMIMAVTVYGMAVVLEIDPARYQGYPLVYFGLEGGILLGLITSYILRGIFGIHQLVQIAYYCGLVFIPAMSICLGKDLGIHFSILILVPLPFFALKFSQRFTIWMSQLMVPAILFANIYYFEHYEALYPLPQELNQMIFIFWSCIFFLSLSLGAYYLWRQTLAAEGMYIAEKEKAQRAHEQLRLKDEAIQMELNMAAEIQKSIMPEEMPAWPTGRIEHIFLPLGKVSGDYYDVFVTDDSLYLLSVDVSGHGVPAALITMNVKRTFGHLIETTGETPASIFKMANEELLKSIVTEDYLTAFLVKITKDGHVMYCNGGHRPALVSRKGSQQVEQLDTPGFPIGALEEASDLYEDREVQLASGDQVFIYTDGIIEQANAEKKLYGLERLEGVISEFSGEDIAATCRNIMLDLYEFRQSEPLLDDITIIAFEQG